METEIITSLTNNFESASHKTEEGISVWFARDLQQLLDHFTEVGKTMQILKNALQGIVNPEIFRVSKVY